MNKQEIQKILQQAERETVYSFILAYAESNTAFCEQLKAALTPKKDDLNEVAYRAKAERCFDFEEEWDRHYNFYQAAHDAASKLGNMLSVAEDHLEQGEYASAAGIATSIVEAIPRNYERVDDSSGYLGNLFYMAVNCIVAILHNGQTPRKIKENIYQWAKQEMNNSVYFDYGFDTFPDVYNAACKEVGETNEVLADLDRLIEKASKYEKENAILWKIRFMQSRNLDPLAVINKYLKMNGVRKIQFERLMESEQYGKALLLAQKGIEIAVKQKHSININGWEKAILEVYLIQGDVENILLQTEKLLYKSYENSEVYYRIMKKYTRRNQWANTLERILNTFEDNSHFNSFIAGIMIEYQMWRRLFDYCKKNSPVADTISQYEKYLKPHFEKEILDIYREYVERLASITHSNAYDSVARMLRHMRTFSGGDAVVDLLLQKYRDIHKRRKNMMNALKNV